MVPQEPERPPSRCSYMNRKSIQKLSIGAAALALFIIVAFLTSWDGFLTRSASGKLGRNLTIDGPTTLDWSWSAPRIRAEKIRLANLQGAQEPYMVEIESADVQFKLWPLLLGRLELPHVKLEQPKIVLERHEDGTKNWDLPAFSKGNAAVEAMTPDNRHDFPMIDSLDITNARIIYRDAPKELVMNVTLDKVAGQDNDDTEQFKIEGEGTMQEKNFTLQAVGGSLSNLRDSNKDFPLDMTVTMGATMITVAGTFKDPVKLQGMDAVLDIKGNNMADLFYFTSLPLPPTPAYTIKANLKKDDDIWSSDKLDGKVGDSDLSGTFTYDASGERALFKANLLSHLLDAKDLGGFIGLSPNQKIENNTLIPDVAINLGRLRASDMDVTWKADKIVAPGVPLKGMDTRFDLKEGVLRLDPLHISLADGAGSGFIVLDGRKDIPDVRINLDLQQLKLSRFFENTRFAELSQGHVGAHIELAGQGKSLADVLADSNGRIVAMIAGGRISLLLIEASNLDVAEATPLLLGKDKATEIRCGVADFKVNQGILTSQIFVLDTVDTNLQGEAKINLRNENLYVKLDAQPKDPSILSVQGPIVIGGTMKNPSIGLDPIESGGRGAMAAVLGTVLTPLAAIIPFIETGLGKDSNCSALIAHAQESGAGP